MLETRMISNRFRGLAAYRLDSLLIALGANLGVVAMLVLWEVVFKERPYGRIGGYTSDSMKAYYLLSLVVGTANWPFWISSMTSWVRNGYIDHLLRQPVSHMRYLFAYAIGTRLDSILMYAMVSGAAIAVFVDVSIKWSWHTLLVAFMMFVIGHCIAFYLGVTVGSAAFWLGYTESVNAVISFVTAFASGATVPLSLLPSWVTKAIGWMPFRFMVSVPVNCLLGAQLALVDVLAAIGWLAVLATLAHVAWRRGLLVYDGQGG